VRHSPFTTVLSPACLAPSSLHWVSRESPEAAGDVALAIEQVQRWNSRKQERYRPLHIEWACQRLRDGHWMIATLKVLGVKPAQQIQEALETNWRECNRGV